MSPTGFGRLVPNLLLSIGRRLVRFVIFWSLVLGYSSHILLVDLGRMINHAMFERNGRSGYVLKPAALRIQDKELLSLRKTYMLDVTVSESIYHPLCVYPLKYG